MSHDCVADSGIQLTEVKNFLNLSADKFLVSIDRGAQVYRWNSVCFLITAKVELFEKDIS